MTVRLSLRPLIFVPLWAGSALAQPLAAGPGCGGDAFSSAEVVEHRPPRHGPLTATPDTLCADLAPQRPPDDIQIGAYPVITPQVGGGLGSVPYERGRPDRVIHGRPGRDRPNPDRPGPDRSTSDRPGRDRAPDPLAAPTASTPDGTADHRRPAPPRPE